MPGWNTVLGEIGKRQQDGRQAIDLVRRKYLRNLHKHSGRNVIAYYSGWLTRPPGTPNLQVGDDDMNAFMAAVHKMKRKEGLDLILHTPGGDIAATEALVKYLWTMFDKNIRVIVPQLAMSAGTMIACSSKEIVMGKQSSLGPIDPQIFGMPAQAILDEFQLAINSIKADPASAPLWQQIISKYHPSFLVECVQAINWSKEMVKAWLLENMFDNNPENEQKAEDIVAFLSDHKTTATHSRHLPAEKCQEIQLNVSMLENDKELQDLVLTVHHAYMHTFSMTGAIKITENHLGVATVLMGVTQVQQAPTLLQGAPNQQPKPPQELELAQNQNPPPNDEPPQNEDSEQPQ